jgi:tRNA 2-selenouridine synthase
MNDPERNKTLLPKRLGWAEVFEQQQRSSKLLNIVDVRSPAEFAKGAIPQSTNMPLFSDFERHLVGYSYKNDGRHRAVAVGLECLARGIVGRLDQWMAAAQDGVLVLCCWRGGLRSYSVAKLLSAVGIECIIVDGGYKGYRRWVTQQIRQLSQQPLVCLVGRTGVGKTTCLKYLSKTMKTIDLEFIAAHRGSTFGRLNVRLKQKNQQQFENGLAHSYANLCAEGHFIVLEMESTLGSIQVPGELRKSMKNAPKIALQASLVTRVSNICHEYAQNWNEQLEAHFFKRMPALRKMISRTIYDQIEAAIKEQDFETAVTLLLEHHYDRAYDKGLKIMEPKIQASVNIERGYQGVALKIEELQNV